MFWILFCVLVVGIYVDFRRLSVIGFGMEFLLFGEVSIGGR